ncbi:MAG: hypothetical protein OXE99_05205 [Cellvibrionales bacterium]|nr:hypothetical protein [Cellvibrionales bacterium]
MSPANLVNEKLYHASLLIKLKGEHDNAATGLANAQVKALDGAISATLKVALNHFIQELAEAVQVQQPSIDLNSLKSTLDKEERGLPPVDALSELACQPTSWVSQIDRAYARFLSLDDAANAYVASAEQDRLLPLVNLDSAIDLPECLQSFKDFISTWRTFLAEW